jgi:hypothetical protein
MSSKKEQQDYNASSSSDTASTNSSSSSDKASGIMRIEEIPTFDLAKIEFLEKLGEGKAQFS